MKDLFGEEIKSNPTRINIYADEVQNHKDQITGEIWMYIGVTFEQLELPILDQLIEKRYCKDRDGWEEYVKNNDSCIHWTEIKSVNERNICERWIESTIVNERFFFSILGINLSNLSVEEFGRKDHFNVIYNRFFRTHISYSLKKFFGKGVIVENIYHEEGQQENSDYFNWHTIFILDKDEHLNFKCNEIVFLPKDHKKDIRSNVVQLTDLYLGVFKDLHLGLPEEVKNSKTFNTYKKPLLEKLVPLLKRTVENPDNVNSSYKTFKRVNISLFPKTKSEKGDIKRLLNNFYEPKDVILGYFEQDNPQMRLPF